ncbi:MAG: RIP metalloprotease RseP [Armatimonadetes bacterium]|nr:RIP metalloprotease RseP [Armatimonadota bacterium]
MTWFEHGSVWLLRAVQIGLVLGGIILIHEFGHFIVAKWSRMVVDEFAVGLGPTIKSWRRDGTLYRVAPFLFMGYVRIRGLEGEPDADELEGSFYRRPVYQRLAVLAAGAAMNVLFAALVFCLLYGLWGVPERPDTTISEVVSGSAAQQAGLQPGWRITAVAGEPTADPGAVREKIAASQGKPLMLRVEQDGAERELTVAPRPDGSGHYLIGVVFEDKDGGFTSEIRRVDPGKAAAVAGLRRGDQIVAVNGQRTEQADDIMAALASVPAADELKDRREVSLPPVAVTVLRGGQEQTFSVQPRPRKEQRLKESGGAEAADQEVETYLVGDVGLALERRYQRLGLAASLREGALRSYEILVGVLSQLGVLLRGQQLDQVGGPVQIVKFLSEAAFLGGYELLNWAGMLSIMIGVFNLLPLPALDGGRMLFILLDPLVRFVLGKLGSKNPSELSRRMETWAHAVGLIALLALMLLVSVRDLTRL